MNNKKLNIIIVCKNLIAVGIIMLIISVVFLFRFNIGFTIFENIEDIILLSMIFIWLISVIIVIIIILSIILLIIYKRKEVEIEE